MTMLNVLTSDSWRRAQLAATGRDPGEVVQIDLAAMSAEERELLEPCIRLLGPGRDERREAGWWLCASAHAGRTWSHPQPQDDPTPAGVLAVARGRAEAQAREERAAEERKRAEEERERKRIEEIRRKIPERAAALRADTERMERGEDPRIGQFSQPPVSEWELVRAGQELAALYRGARAAHEAAHKARTARIRAEERARLEARERAEADLRQRWLEQEATPDQRKRAARGLLPEEEVTAGLEAVAFAALEGVSLYQDITPEELESGSCDEFSEEHDMSCTSGPAESATADEFAALEAIEERARAIPRGVLAGAEVEVTLREHVCTCDRSGCYAEARRAGVRVLVRPAGTGFRLMREFAAEVSR